MGKISLLSLWEYSWFVPWNVPWFSLSGKQQCSKNAIKELLHHPVIHLHGIYSQNAKMIMEKDVGISIFRAVLSIVARMWK